MRTSIFFTLALLLLTGIPPLDTARLLQLEDLTYSGAFRVPHGPFGDPKGEGFNYADSGLTYNAANNSLFINGHVYTQLTAEISIPEIVVSTRLEDLKTAPVLQNLSDITEGHLGNILAKGARTRSPLMGGILVYRNKLIGTAYDYYDASNASRLSHFTSELNLSQAGDFRGMFLVGADSSRTGFVSGYMALIPPEWQAALGGPALTGNCCISIISRTSWGPAASVFDPDKLGIANPVPSFPLIEYPSAHPLARYANGLANKLFEEGDEMRGLVFPVGSRSVLFFGRHGLGPFCYGEGSKNPALKDHPESSRNGTGSCYDPVIGSKGSHSYPYAHYVWAYDASDLVAVKKGRKNPWDVRPYGLWTLPLPEVFGIRGYAGIQGAAYDPATQRIFISQKHGDGNLPLIHVFTLRGTAAAAVK